MPSAEANSSSFSANSLNLHNSFTFVLENRVDAVIALHSDEQTKEDGARFLEYLNSVTDSFDPGVMLYIVEDESKVSASTIDWCHENGFEVVSLKNEEEEEDQEDERFRDKTGVDRILEALESHMWTNMEYKTDLRPQKERKAAVEFEEKEIDEIEEKDILDDMPADIKASFGNLLNFMNITPDTAPNSLRDDDDLGFVDGDGADFLSALGPLQQLRSQLSTLDDDKRRAMAAKVALMMMESLGDDDEDDFI